LFSGGRSQDPADVDQGGRGQRRRRQAGGLRGPSAAQGGAKVQEQKGAYDRLQVVDVMYDHNFLRFLTILEKKWAFFSKTGVMIKILHYLALF
jgi:hypothetical protein